MIRVLRILEYTYDTPEIMEKDMARWQLGANATKIINAANGMTIKSSIMLPETTSEVN